MLKVLGCRASEIRVQRQATKLMEISKAPIEIQTLL